MAYTVTITKTGNDTDYGIDFVTINETSYSDAATVTVNEGTEITCVTAGSIILNGTVVATGDDHVCEYTFTVTNDVQIVIYFAYGTNNRTITITMEEKPADPLEPKDGHNTLINGVACQIESGTVLIGGVAYEIEKGEVMIGGTVYEIPFGPNTYTLSITSPGNKSKCYIRINGENYSSATTAMELAEGTEVYCYAYGTGNATRITYNGTSVASGRYGIDYTFAVTSNTTVAMTYNSSSSNTTAIIEITTS